MISIVVCSISSILFDKFEKNVLDTIGIEFEIIRIDNRINPVSIAEAYNKGLKKAQGEIICFCHEDIIFENFGWGPAIHKFILDNDDIGLVGVAGTVYKSAIPAPWVALPKKYYRINMLQKFNDGRIERHELGGRNIAEVAVLDGCFIAGKTKIFNQFLWNSSLLKDFHLYDLDISLRVGQDYKLVVTNHILLTHLSEGNFNLPWLKDSQNFHIYYKQYFPLNVLSITKKEIKFIEYFTLNNHVRILIRLKQPLRIILFYYFKMILLFPLKSQTFYLLKHIICA